MEKKEQYSYSKLDLYEGCGFKYKLKYLDKIQFKWTDTIATEFGTCIHSIEEDIAKAMEPMYTTDAEHERSGMGFTFMEVFMDDLKVFSDRNKGTTIVMKKTFGVNAD